MCEYILECYVDFIYKESKEGWNVILYVVKNGYINVLKFFNVKKVSFEYKFESDRNVLYIVCDNGYFEVCEYVLENFFFLLKIVDYKGRYVFYFVVRSGSLEIMKYFELKMMVI